ncbi:glycosyltransferase [Cyanobium sp. WAJ14-Wanaka]|uniref:glycosyltransferase n=1 Tax=Cyanobium sp. WAJ14-Wanaka TaxID=2823725 RepID=UPI0020CDE5C1|nr:glycosyltransferase [Cyanobium sp. WAJ14-Wanaka]MCP9775697.1 glycosyltransferase [Cyanobium sp. WAJ14-Wanaka]
MADPLPLAPGLGDQRASGAVLDCWRSDGAAAAARQLKIQLAKQDRQQGGSSADPLLAELALRLEGRSGPRLLVDGLWFCRPFGGISRVWEQILDCWSLPGLVTNSAPVALIERNSHLALSASFPNLQGAGVDPLDPEAVAALAPENSALLKGWRADVFISSWISSSGPERPSCPELALVHDCLPERYGVAAPLAQLRRRWLKGATAHLAVSAATAADLEVLLSRPTGSLSWCHPAPAPLFGAPLQGPRGDRLWAKLIQRSGLQQPYLLLPATSAIGSYKNPELVAEALADPQLAPLQLVLCGIAAEQRCRELEQRFPHLGGRCLAAGFTDLELALAYHHALAVVIPSRAEGFGLPAVEALASGATVLVADSPGLREAGGSAALRFHPQRPGELAALLALLLDPTSGWLQPHLACRRQKRLAPLHADLIGLALLALARRLAP